MLLEFFEIVDIFIVSIHLHYVKPINLNSKLQTVHNVRISPW